MFVCLFQSPPKGATIPYRPKPQVGGPVILAGGQAYTIQGNYAVPAHSDVSMGGSAARYLGPPASLAPPLGPAHVPAAALAPVLALEGHLPPPAHCQFADVSPNSTPRPQRTHAVRHCTYVTHATPNTPCHTPTQLRPRAPLLHI